MPTPSKHQGQKRNREDDDAAVASTSTADSPASPEVICLTPYNSDSNFAPVGHKTDENTVNLKFPEHHA